MVCILVNWQRHFEEDTQIVMDEDGTSKLFESAEDAVDWAEENLNWEWKVVSLSKVEGANPRQEMDAFRPAVA